MESKEVKIGERRTMSRANRVQGVGGLASFLEEMRYRLHYLYLITTVCDGS